MESIENNCRYRCEKHRVDVTQRSPRCKDPELYCKFRSACVINFLEKEARKSLKKIPS
jgi:hypothetical protein